MELCRTMNVELRIWNFELVGFADYQLSNVELLFNIQSSILNSEAMSFNSLYILLTSMQAKLAKL